LIEEKMKNCVLYACAAISVAAGLAAAILWLLSALVKNPKHEMISSVVPDARGEVPLDRWAKDVAWYNRYAAICTAISVAFGAAVTYLELP
jgi:hypothetical protein